MTSISYLNLSLWISSSIFKNFKLLKQFDVSISLELFENFNKEPLLTSKLKEEDSTNLIELFNSSSS